MNALNKQVGGNHYKVFNIQPIEYTTSNSFRPFAVLAIRYFIRVKDNIEQDWVKARHLLEIELEMKEYHPFSPMDEDRGISSNAFISENNLDVDQAFLITMIDQYHTTSNINFLKDALSRLDELGVKSCL